MRIKYFMYCFAVSLRFLGFLTCIPCLVALIYKEFSSVIPFLLTAMIMISCSYVCQKIVNSKGRFKGINDIKKSEGLFIVTLSWVLTGLMVSIPYLFFGFSPINALFEGVSGITTTGATILTRFDYPHAMIFWRSFTQWLGGMGIIVLFIAVLPQFAVAGRQMFFAETPGPTEEKFTPRIRSTASYLWIIYVGLTVLEIICLSVAGMPLFDSICNSFSTISNGGFCPNPNSVMGYNSNHIVWIVMVFIFIAGTSFNLQHRVYSKFNPLLFWKNEEFRAYTFVFLGISTLVGLSLNLNDHFNLFDSITNACYQVISVMTSTGSVSSNYSDWNFTTQLCLLLAFMTGGCASSAAGGAKIVRWIILLKVLKSEFKKILHPNAIINIKYNNTIIQRDVLRQIVIFMIFYAGIVVFTAFLLCFIERNTTVGVVSALSSLGNIGPSMGGSVGALGNFSELHASSKLILVMNMLIGRLELIPFLVFLERDFYNFKYE